ncbi:MAG: Tex-like N-terminal domain-containing protein, partial [Halanaerobiales bacterium]
MKMEDTVKTIASEFGLPLENVKNTVQLLEDENTVPFIARYRKEMTGNLDEEEIREIRDRLDYICRLEERKEEVIRLINKQDKLTSELEEKIINASILQEVEDLYRPYKQKKRTRAAKAREKGLEPLAELIWEQQDSSVNLKEAAEEYLDPENEINTIEEALAGARDIIAEWVSDDPDIRKGVRKLTYEQGKIESSIRDKEDDEDGKYQMYYDFSEPVKEIKHHRVLALNRGENEEILKVKITAPEENIIAYIEAREMEGEVFCEQLREGIEDSYKRLIAPSIEREIRGKLTERAEEHALDVFGQNLRSILLQPPLKGKVIMGIDPGF